LCVVGRVLATNARRECRGETENLSGVLERSHAVSCSARAVSPFLPGCHLAGVAGWRVPEFSAPLVIQEGSYHSAWRGQRGSAAALSTPEDGRRPCVSPQLEFHVPFRQGVRPLSAAAFGLLPRSAGVSVAGVRICILSRFGPASGRSCLVGRGVRQSSVSNYLCASPKDECRRPQAHQPAYESTLGQAESGGTDKGQRQVETEQHQRTDRSRNIIWFRFVLDAEGTQSIRKGNSGIQEDQT